MKLVSTFRDYYDFAFDGKGQEFHRVGGNTGPHKMTQLVTLARAGYRVPPHGPVGEVLGSYWRDWLCPEEGHGNDFRIRHVVAYTDPMAHCTEGKTLYRYGQLSTNPRMDMPGGDFYWKENSQYCTAFIGDPHKLPSVSWRRLQVGRRVFWLEYLSRESWMSNDGDGDTTVLGEGNLYYPDASLLNHPIYAIDFVIGKELYAVDLNTAPGMGGSGLEKLMSPLAVVKEIEWWYDQVAK